MEESCRTKNEIQGRSDITIALFFHNSLVMKSITGGGMIYRGKKRFLKQSNDAFPNESIGYSTAIFTNLISEL